MRPATSRRARIEALLLGGLSATFTLADGGVRAEPADASRPPAVAEETLSAGRELFARDWSPRDRRSHGGDGLGPVFNAKSCVACHDLGGPGGAGASERNIEIATAAGFGVSGSPNYGFAYAFAMDFGAGRFEYSFSNAPAATGRRPPPADPAILATIHPGFRAARSVVLHRFGTDAAYHTWRDGVPGPHGNVVVQTSQRNPTPLFGVGQIDAIPDEAIEAAAKPRSPGPAKVKGRVSRLADGRVGRFGWKAQTATLREFTLSAAATEVGLEVPGHHQAADPRLPGIGSPGLDMDEAECAALVAYVRALPGPVTRVPLDAGEAAQLRAGEATFRALGCVHCHLPKLGEVDGIYSDLLLHDMSPRLADTGAYGVFVSNAAGADGPAPAGGPRGGEAVASLQEWRTPPLWGLRDSAPYLHDGRAATLDQAITLHGGQGASASQRYAQLSAHRRRQLEAFLLSLSAPPREDARAGLAEAR